MFILTFWRDYETIWYSVIFAATLYLIIWFPELRLYECYVILVISSFTQTKILFSYASLSLSLNINNIIYRQSYSITLGCPYVQLLSFYVRWATETFYIDSFNYIIHVLRQLKLTEGPLLNYFLSFFVL